MEKEVTYIKLTVNDWQNKKFGEKYMFFSF